MRISDWSSDLCSSDLTQSRPRCCGWDSRCFRISKRVSSINFQEPGRSCTQIKNLCCRTTLGNEAGVLTCPRTTMKGGSGCICPTTPMTDDDTILETGTRSVTDDMFRRVLLSHDRMFIISQQRSLDRKSVV